MKETSKCYKFREEKGYFDKYLSGSGIDIGGGDDPLRIKNGNVYCYDLKQGDAQYMANVKTNTYDFVYSSHCLEHMNDLEIAFHNWIRICKPGGYLYITVPHETYYEHDVWPSRWNAGHRWSFTLDSPSNMPKNIVLKVFLNKFINSVQIIDVFENLQNYDFAKSKSIDQTFKFEDNVCAQIDAILRKK